MNRKQFLLIIVVGACLCVAGWVLWKKDKAAWTDSPHQREKLLPDFPLNDVAQMQIINASAEVNLYRKDERWVVKERADFPANFDQIRDFLIKLEQMKPGEPIEVGQSRLGRLELLDPAKGTNDTATKVELKDKNAKTLNTLLLGKKHMEKSPSASPYGGGEWPKGRYLMLDSDLKSVCLVKEPMTEIEPKPEQWLNKDFIKVEKIIGISLTHTNATNSWKISRTNDTAQWTLVEAGKDEKLDSVKATSAGSAMSSPYFSDVVAEAKDEVTGLNKPVTAVLETSDHFTYTLKFGNKTSDDNSYHLGFTVAFNPPRERTPGKDEKPEDKEKLDKEFNDNLKKLEEKFKKEKALEQWNYLVSKWTVESLVKPRSELLEAKKEEPKPAETSNAPETTEK